MQIVYNSRCVPKMGSSHEEYEDAAWPENNGKAADPSFRCAVADGASESTFAKEWAHLLVHSYCMNLFDDPESLQRTLPQLQVEWRSQINTTGFSWFSREKLRDGAFCTFLGLSLLQTEENEIAGTWNAMAIGDTCLFHVRDRELVRKFPLDQAEQFGISPDLLSSTWRNDDLAQRIRIATHDWQAGDEFYLMTDALACWSMIEETGTSTKDWLAYLDMFTSGEPSDFANHVDSFRNQKRMRDDDVTLVRVQVSVDSNATKSL